MVTFLQICWKWHLCEFTFAKLKGTGNHFFPWCWGYYALEYVESANFIHHSWKLFRSNPCETKCLYSTSIFRQNWYKLAVLVPCCFLIKVKATSRKVTLKARFLTENLMPTRSRSSDVTLNHQDHSVVATPACHINIISVIMMMLWTTKVLHVDGNITCQEGTMM